MPNPTPLQLLCATVLTLTTLTIADLNPVRREVYGEGRIIDITHQTSPDLPSWFTGGRLGRFLWLTDSMKNGSLANGSVMKLQTHTGTHVDAPGHFYDHYFDAGFDVDTLDLDVLNGENFACIMFVWLNLGFLSVGLNLGPVLLVDVPRDKNITAEVMESLHIPDGVHRVLFRTLNTDRRLMYKSEYDTSYVGFMKDGAKWLVENTNIKLVGRTFNSLFRTPILCNKNLWI
ncbi:Kynurenine formamidase/cyclase-like [Dillenia turbinata]|uniref:Kynurenine formamidase/cyclase-like n=1 Tax=Dillenia turbinata TaxID=194707 RepID=A0AAN8UVU8_9MAGN